MSTENWKANTENGRKKSLSWEAKKEWILRVDSESSGQQSALWERAW